MIDLEMLPFFSICFEKYYLLLVYILIIFGVCYTIFCLVTQGVVYP